MKFNPQITSPVIQDGFVLKVKCQNTVKHFLVAQVNISKDNSHSNPLNTCISSYNHIH